jgi:hypothetical protein
MWFNCETAGETPALQRTCAPLQDSQFPFRRLTST